MQLARVMKWFIPMTKFQALKSNSNHMVRDLCWCNSANPDWVCVVFVSLWRHMKTWWRWKPKRSKRARNSWRWEMKLRGATWSSDFVLRLRKSRRPRQTWSWCRASRRIRSWGLWGLLSRKAYQFSGYRGPYSCAESRWFSQCRSEGASFVLLFQERLR